MNIKELDTHPCDNCECEDVEWHLAENTYVGDVTMYTCNDCGETWSEE